MRSKFINLPTKVNEFDALEWEATEAAQTFRMKLLRPSRTAMTDERTCCGL